MLELSIHSSSEPTSNALLPESVSGQLILPTGANRLDKSACSTATGTGNGLNDRDSFARSALAAGVPNVVASRWSVDSIATREWMTFFYENAIAGESVGSAATRARFGLKAKSERGHPFYWAAFSVFVSETKSQNTGAF
jgi:CHAT domain